MKFVIDAQLPQDLIELFKIHECDWIHVNSLPNKDRTKDKELREFADSSQIIVITKDFDFYHSHMTIRKPEKLLLVTTGNIRNRKLVERFRSNLPAIFKAIRYCHFVELSNSEIMAL